MKRFPLLLSFEDIKYWYHDDSNWRWYSNVLRNGRMAALLVSRVDGTSRVDDETEDAEEKYWEICKAQKILWWGFGVYETKTRSADASLAIARARGLQGALPVVAGDGMIGGGVTNLLRIGDLNAFRSSRKTHAIVLGSTDHKHLEYVAHSVNARGITISGWVGGGSRADIYLGRGHWVQGVGCGDSRFRKSFRRILPYCGLGEHEVHDPRWWQSVTVDGVTRKGTVRDILTAYSWVQYVREVRAAHSIDLFMQIGQDRRMDRLLIEFAERAMKDEESRQY